MLTFSRCWPSVTICPETALVLSRLEECRTSSAELSLHSCWCQLPCPPSLLSSRLLSPPFVPHRKVNCCHLLTNVGNTSFRILPYLTPSFFTHVSRCSVINVKPSCPAGIPTLTIAITIPSCSSRPCWLAMSHSHPTRR